MTGLLAGPVPGLPQPGEHIGRYRVVRELGRGPLGVVVEAQHEDTGERCAVKLLTPAAPMSAEGGARIRDELDTLSRVDASGILVPVELGAHGAQVFLASPLRAGNLADRMAAGLSRRTALEIVLQVADALAAAETVGVAHGGIRPTNVLLDADGQVAQLGDFGAALRRQQWTAPPGSPEQDQVFVAPEVLAGNPADHRSDQYSLGAVLLGALAGGIDADGPHSADSAGSTGSTGDAAELDEVVARAMHPDPDQRFPTVAAMAERIRALLAAEERAARFTPGEEPGALPSAVLQDALTGMEDESLDGSGPGGGFGSIEWWRRWRTPLVAGAGLLLLVVAVGSLLLSRQDSSPAESAPPLANAPAAKKPAPPRVDARAGYRSVEFQLAAGGGSEAGVQVDTGKGWHAAKGESVTVRTGAGGERACLRARTVSGDQHSQAVRRCAASQPRSVRAVRVHPDCLIDGQFRQVCYGLEARGFRSDTDPVLTFRVDGSLAGTVSVHIGADGTGTLPDGQHFHFADADAGKTAEIDLDGVTYKWQVASR